MSAFQDLASPAPQVEAAEASPCGQTDKSDELWSVEPARPCEEASAQPAPVVGAAVPFDNPRAFAPPLSKEKASHLSVAALKSGTGAEFESKAAVIKGKVERTFWGRLLPFFLDERVFVAFGEVARFVFVKANVIFVYSEATDPSPLYAIELQNIVAVQDDSKKPDEGSFSISPHVNTNEARENLVTILLKDRVTRQQKYQITFDTTSDKSVAKRFMDILAVNTKLYGSELVTASIVIPETAGKSASKK